MGRPHALPKATVKPTVSSSDLSFYRRRIVSATKSIARGKHDSEEVKDAFTSYAACLINNFKAEDRAEQLQEEFNGLKRKSRQNARAGAAIDAARKPDALMMRVAHDDTMGGYVERKSIKRVPPKVPKIKPINLRRKELGRKR
jgi:hypothetical protein